MRDDEPGLSALESTIQETLRVLSRALGYAAGCVLLHRAPGEVLLCHGAAHLSVAQKADLTHLSAPDGLAARVAASGLPACPTPAEQAGLTAPGQWVAVPLRAGSRVDGVLLLLAPRPADEHATLDVAALLATHPIIESGCHGLALAVQSARHLQRQQRRAESLQLVSEISRRLAAILEPADLLQAMVAQIQRTFGYYYVGVSLVEEGALIIKAAAGRGGRDGATLQPHPAEVVLPIGPGSIVGLVAATGRPQIFPDIREEPNYYWLPEMGPVRSALTVPLRFEEAVIGVLDLESDELEAFDDDDLMLAEVLAAQAAVAIANARLYHQARRRAQEVEALLDTAQDINSELHLELLLQRVTQRALEITRAEAALVGHVEDDEVLYHYIRTPRAWVPYRARFPLTRGWIHQAVRRRQPYLTNDAPNDPHALHDFVASYQISAALTVPILDRRGTVLGTIHALNMTAGHHFDADDARLLTAFANQAAIAFENARLYELEQEKVEALQELERLKSEFLSSVSHDLRTPLTVLRTASQAFPSAGPLTPLQQRLIDNIQRNTERMAALVSDLLEMAKLQSGRLRLNLQRVALREALDDLVAELEPLLREREVGVAMEIAAPPPMVIADSRRLHQILLNLLGNAARFSPVGGTITLSVAAGEGGVTVSVRDEGPGIPAAEQQRIFDRFYRLEGGGSGLGLAIARSLAELHGGTLGVESMPGAGATFRLWLPHSAEEHDANPDR